MKKKQIIDLIIAAFLILAGVVILTLPLLKIINIYKLFITVFTFYAIINLVQFLTTMKDKDYEGLFTTLASVITIIVAIIIDITSRPGNLAITLFVWVILMSLIKLKKSDYYHDRGKLVWIVRIITLVLFILTGVLSTINLYCGAEVQTLVLGFFFYIHGILELIDPLSVYLENKKSN